MNYEENISAIRIVYDALGDLKNKVAFVGGVVVPLYADTQSIEARFTSDVDVIIELLNYPSLARLEESQCRGTSCLGASKLSWCRILIECSCGCPGARSIKRPGKWLRVMQKA